MPNNFESMTLGIVAFALMGTGIAMIREPIGTWHCVREVVQGIAGNGLASAWFWFALLLVGLIHIAH